MYVLPYIYVLMLKNVDVDDTSFLKKARFCFRRDLQTPELYLSPSSIYFPVELHEAIRILLSVEASEDLIIEVGDVRNAYLYGDI